MGLLSFLKKKESTDHKSMASYSNDFVPESFMRALGRHGMFATKSGVAVNEHTVLFTAAAFACQRAISESLAMLPREIYERSPDGVVKREITDHSVLPVLQREANPLQSTYKFFETLQHHVLSSGNGYAEIQRRRGSSDVVALWPLPPDRVRPEIVEDEEELKIIYKVKLRNDREVIMHSENVLHIPGLGYDGFVGYPVIEFMSNAVGLSQAIEEYGSLFFKQGAQTPGYVSVPDEFDEDQIKNLKKHYNIINEGLENAHRTKFLYESAKYTASGATPEQSQMVEAKVFQIQEIARFYRMPLHKIQETSGNTSYNSLEQFNVEFVTDTLMPWITNWEQELNRKLFIEKKDAKKYVKFNVNALLRGDLTSRSNYYRTLVMAGILTPNEARGLEELPPITGGDKLMTPSNMAEVSDSDIKKADDAKERVQD